ncbi:MAG: hypothetical protein EP332_03325 [Bacteroidetes bacterium]|nr:MAG: hypothetical protein EP332_03325 [Bacteroidota bacterium]
MRIFLSLISFALFFLACSESKHDFKNLRLEQDTLLTLDAIPSQFIAPRKVQVWLPAGYGTQAGQNYKLIVMLNGSEVFGTNNSTQTWNADGIMDSLQKRLLIEPTIVASVWEGEHALLEWTPRLEDKNGNPATLSSSLKSFLTDEGIVANGLELNTNYSEYIAKELWPYLQSHFSISKDPKNNTVIGGGRAALAAFKLFTKYPNLIGNAGCLSPEWNLPHGYGDEFVKLVSSIAPEPGNRRLYFDYGTAGTDAQQKQFQQRIDLTLTKQGYFRGKHYLSLEIKGAEPSPDYWRIRLHKPFQFLQRK